MAQPRLRYNVQTGEMEPMTRMSLDGSMETLMEDGSWQVTSAPPGPTTWTNDTFDQFWNNTEAGGRFDPRAGDIFPILTPEDLQKWGFGMQSPDPTKGLNEWFPNSGFTNLRDFQEATQSLPFDFTDTGAVYNPGARVNPMNYEGTPDWREAATLAAIGAIGGAGLMGLGQGGAGAAAAAGGGEAAAGGLGGLADFSLVPAGSNVGIGGVGTAGLGLNTAGIGLTPGLVAAGGGAAAMGLPGSLGLQAINTAGSALGASTMGAGASGGGFWDTVMNGLSSPTGSALQQIIKGGGNLLEWLQSKDNAEELARAINAASERGDPFGPERPFYQNMLRQSYTDPNFWKNNAVFKGISDVASSDAQRVAAARGFNNSSNVLYDVADRIQKTGMNYATNFQGQLATNAGAGISPGTSASIAAQGANQVMQANQQKNGALGSLVDNIPNIVSGIKGILS